MKTLITAFIFLCGIALSASAHPQQKHLMAAYKSQGDDLFIPLYWLPETRQTVLKHIPDHGNWVGFEVGLWKKIAEDKKMGLLWPQARLLVSIHTSWSIYSTPQRGRDWSVFRDCSLGSPKQNQQNTDTGQPATSPESKPEGGDKPQPEAEGRSR